MFSDTFPNHDQTNYERGVTVSQMRRKAIGCMDFRHTPWMAVIKAWRTAIRRFADQTITDLTGTPRDLAIIQSERASEGHGGEKAESNDGDKRGVHLFRVDEMGKWMLVVR